MLTLLAGVAEVIIVSRSRVDPWKLAALLESLTLVLAIFVGFTASDFVALLRGWAAGSLRAAIAMPYLLLVPYLVFGLGTRTFAWAALGKLAAYITVPTALVLPDRRRAADRVGWRDLAAMVSLAAPVAAHGLEGIWAWPQELYVFRPLVCVCLGAYDFMVIRGLDGVGFGLSFFTRNDFVEGLGKFVGFGVLAIPLGMILSFIHPHRNPVGAGAFAFQFFGIYITIALPEEFLFRGVLQNFLVRSIPHRRQGLFGLLIASAVFGAAHLHHAPVPNWRYALLATLAGIFYGMAYQAHRRLSASALTHALVDTTWHFWF